MHRIAYSVLYEDAPMGACCAPRENSWRSGASICEVMLSSESTDTSLPLVRNNVWHNATLKHRIFYICIASSISVSGTWLPCACMSSPTAFFFFFFMHNANTSVTPSSLLQSSESLKKRHFHCEEYNPISWLEILFGTLEDIESRWGGVFFFFLLLYGCHLFGIYSPIWTAWKIFISSERCWQNTLLIWRR